MIVLFLLIVTDKPYEARRYYSKNVPIAPTKEGLKQYKQILPA